MPLRQAVSAYEEIRAQGFLPRDIVIGGDSAGGNLTMQFLGHALHPQTGVTEIKLSEPFGGAFLVSPYLGRADSGPSFTKFHYNDMVSRDIIKKLSYEVVRPEEYEARESMQEPWSLPLEANHGWFQDFDTVVPKIYVTWGEREVMGDHSRAMIETLKREAPGVDMLTYEAPKELHDGLLLEHLFKKPAMNTKKMKTWYKSVIMQ
ncbi:hypothetical protein NLG97_g4982 [Lecanicillium saksenae]|uniref:Uncharacterized protein n=1 Tax=Lecanicillium saksenae TaxID=468837 RepID=A0ACC1QVF3_9HYPO|nr:hypothetical protein NLG97_g4982 [Lecanicillium saksenae]